tara:strand:- start:556 stop:699 length:144 start_codon:yes stop_codon:yes gene_type:complete
LELQHVEHPHAQPDVDDLQKIVNLHRPASVQSQPARHQQVIIGADSL